MSATIWLLVVWLVSLVVEVPVIGHFYPGSSATSASAAIQVYSVNAIFALLIILFLVYAWRGKRWSFTGAAIVGAVNAVLSAGVGLMPGGPPLGVTVWTTLPSVLVVIAATVSVVELRQRRTGAPPSPYSGPGTRSR
jgi:hypothetical protein